jgi:acyl-CoA synthetase (AMP-forming)/AMP-acid ligase II
MRDQTLSAAIRRQGRDRPQAIACIDPQRTWTFGDIDRESSRVAQGLKSLGVGPGDRVACLSKHAAPSIVLVLAACKIGAVGMPINWRLAAPEIEYVLNNGEAKFLMVDRAFQETVGRAVVPSLRHVVSTEEGAPLESFATWRARFQPQDPGHEADPQDTAVQLFSSGTTGLPKGIELTHANLTLMNELYAEDMGYDGSRSVFLNALPFFHIAGINSTLMPLIEGGMNVLVPEFDPAHVISIIGDDAFHAAVAGCAAGRLLHAAGDRLRRLPGGRAGADRRAAHLRLPAGADLRDDRVGRHAHRAARRGP